MAKMWCLHMSALRPDQVNSFAMKKITYFQHKTYCTVLPRLLAWPAQFVCSPDLRMPDTHTEPSVALTPTRTSTPLVLILHVISVCQGFRVSVVNH